MSSDPEDFEDYEEPSQKSLEGILVRMVIREFTTAEKYRNDLRWKEEELKDMQDEIDGLKNKVKDLYNQLEG